MNYLRGIRATSPVRCARLLLPVVLVCTLLLPARAVSDDVILFPYFKDPGTQGVFLMASRDGLVFEHLNGGNPIFTVPEGVTRDPSIVRGPDERFHMVWTAGTKSIGYASSPDLVSWSTPRTIPVWGPDDNVVNTWAPELFYDEVEEEFLVVWASTDRDRFPTTGSSEPDPDGIRFEHRLYAATTTDFETLSDTWLFFDPGFNVIDGMIAHDVAGNRFAMAFKDERLLPQLQKNIRLAFSDSAQGLYGEVTESLTGGGVNFDQWAEGPTLLRFEDGWRLYFDTYFGWGNVYNALESTDLENWVDITDQLIFPEIEGHLQHGTLFRITTSPPPAPTGDLPMCKAKIRNDLIIEKTRLVDPRKVQEALDKGLTRGECNNPQNGQVLCKTKRGKRVNVLVPDNKVLPLLDTGFFTRGACSPLPGEPCGPAVCGPGTTCCNPLLGICVEPGMACIL